MSERARHIVVGGVLILGFVVPFVLGAVAERLLPPASTPSVSVEKSRDDQNDEKIWYGFGNRATPRQDGIKYRLDFDRALADAKLLNRPVFVYFTSVNDANARYIHQKVLRAPSVVARLRQFVCAALFVDIVPYPDKAEASRLREDNARHHKELIGDPVSPAFAIIRPDFDDPSHPESRRPLAKADVWEIDDEATVVRLLDDTLRKWSPPQVPQQNLPYQTK
jgi:hypothetical protein